MQKVFKHLHAMLCRDGFGVELHPLNIKLPVPDTDAFQTWLLTEFQDNHETIMYAPGGGFFSDPALGKTQVRFAYVLNCQNLERAMDLLKLGIAQYNGR